VISLYDLRCPRCGSYAYHAEEVPPLPGSVTAGLELKIECLDCGLSVTNAPERARESFTGHQRSDAVAARLDHASLCYCGLVVAGKSQRDEEAQREIQKLIRWPASPVK
jgi:hypothetical protein